MEKRKEHKNIERENNKNFVSNIILYKKQKRKLLNFIHKRFYNKE